MFDWDEESYHGRSDPLWRQLDRLGRDLHIVIHNEIETRRFLAQEVYRVPEVWLDDVLRLRLADLDR